MNLKGVGPTNVVNLYNKNSVKRVEKSNEVQAKDRIELSELAKSLRAYDEAGITSENKARIQELREKISNGTYKIDAKVTAESIMNFIKESRGTDDN